MGIRAPRQRNGGKGRQIRGKDEELKKVESDFRELKRMLIARVHEFGKAVRTVGSELTSQGRRKRDPLKVKSLEQTQPALRDNEKNTPAQTP